MGIHIMNQTTDVTDFYPFMTDNNAAKWTLWAFSCIITTTGPLAFYSVIWFERYGSDRKRTLLNMLFSQFCWICIGFCFAGQMVEMIRYAIGPLPSTICLMQFFLRITMSVTAVLIISAMMITR